MDVEVELSGAQFGQLVEGDNSPFRDGPDSWTAGKRDFNRSGDPGSTAVDMGLSADDAIGDDHPADFTGDGIHRDGTGPAGTQVAEERILLGAGQKCGRIYGSLRLGHPIVAVAAPRRYKGQKQGKDQGLNYVPGTGAEDP